MTADSAPTRLATSSLNPRVGHDFDLRPNAETCAAIADELDALTIRKLRFQGSLRATGGRGWTLDATLGATVVQPCTVTLQPVTTRIDTPVIRRFVPPEEIEPAPGAEIEIPEDDTLEPLGAEIDLRAVMTEALALAMPEFPRADDAHLGAAFFAEEGVTPLRDEDVKPFAGLAGLRDTLRKADRNDADIDDSRGDSGGGTSSDGGGDGGD